MPYPQPFKLDGKVAVVTGAASGLGVAFLSLKKERRGCDHGLHCGH